MRGRPGTLRGTFQYRTTAVGQPSRGFGVTGRQYAPLFKVDIHHTYYDADGGRCPDLDVQPSADSLRTMAALGLEFRSGTTGFAVYFNEARTDELLAFLATNRSTGRRPRDGQPGYWSRLSFVLTPANPDFVNITSLPITTNPLVENLYASNTQAQADGQAVRLCQGPYLDRRDLYPVVGDEVSVTAPAGARAIVVTDLSGAVVSGRVIRRRGPGAPRVVLNLGGLPFGLYTVSALGGDRAGGWTVIRTGGNPPPLCLLDVLFTQPRPDSPGVYPVPSLWDGRSRSAQAVGGVDYALPFNARSTEWRYYVVPQGTGGWFTQLRIEGKGADFERADQPVQLPNGSMAALFTSQSDLPLRRVPPQRFRLSGQRRNADGSEQTIRIDCLPAAPPAPVWPGSTDESGTSEMYVYV